MCKNTERAGARLGYDGTGMDDGIQSGDGGYCTADIDGIRRRRLRT